MIHTTLDAAEIAKVQDFVLAERRKCVSDREWQFRLRGYGYGVRPHGDGHVVTELLRARDLFQIDAAALRAPAPTGM